MASQLLEKTQVVTMQESEQAVEQGEEKPMEVEVRESEESDDDEGFTFSLSRWFKPVKPIGDAGLEKVKEKVEEYLVTVAVKLANGDGQKLRRLERRKRELIAFVKELKIECQ